MKALAISLTLIGSLLIAALPSAAQTPQCDFSTYPESFTCTLPTPSAPATATPIPPSPTTVVPQPLITPTPIPAVATIDGVPVCPDDDVTWHSTVERNSDGSIRCTYGHEHGDDPHELDQTFGPMGGWWNGWLEHDISYPWETTSENETKHTAYKIIVRGSDATPLTPWYTIGAPNYIRAFRGTYHADGPKGLVMSEKHSFELEVQVCSADGNCGILRTGGVQHLGERHIDEVATGLPQYQCLFKDPTQPDSAYVCGGQTDAQGHPIVDPVRSTAGRPGGGRRDETWYGANRVHYEQPGVRGITVSFGIILGHVWGPIDPPNPMRAASPDPKVRGDYPPHYARTPYTPFNVDDWHHDSSRELSAFGLSYSLAADASGRINASGYTDPEGNVDTSCTAAGPVCVPFVFENVPPGPSGFRDLEYSQATGSASQVINYDVVDPTTGHSLIVWPN